jgi:hypothetical protein
MKLSIGSLAAIALAAAAMFPRAANADEASQSRSPYAVEKTSSQATGPSWMMVGSGIGIFALSYVPVVAVGATSGLPADQNLYVPIVGPWIDFADRPGCPAGTSCNVENTDRVLLVTDGILQGVGVITVIGGFLSTAHETKTVRTVALSPTLQLTPARVGKGYGVMAAGSF